MEHDLYINLWEAFKAIGSEAMTMNHYDLAEVTDFEPDIWKQFLMEQEVQDWIRTELKLIQESELKKMIKDVSKSRSVGQAQLMNSLAKLNEDKQIKDGPIFIYSYVPMNKEQHQAPNSKEENSDIFLKGGK